MNIYSYVVTRDYGFAPNPFGEYCTLATCKPRIRAAAAVGDWVVGTGSKQLGMESSLIFAMQVSEAMSFTAYWNDPRFAYKKPVMNGSVVQMFGDNIYHQAAGEWVQANSHHSHEDGSANELNIKKDTQADRVLVSTNFYYFGKAAPVLPEELADVFKVGIGHKKLTEAQAQSLIDWLRTNHTTGLQDDPIEFDNKQFDRYDGK